MRCAQTPLFEFVNNSAPLATLGANGYKAPVSVVAPGVLFDDIEFELPQDQLPRLLVVPAERDSLARSYKGRILILVSFAIHYRAK